MNSDSYTAQRKTLLEKLDKKEKVSNLELGMYDLTPYFKDEFNASLFEAIMLNKNYKRKINHLNQDLFFSPPQIRALDKLKECNRVILSAPTSFGKTLLIKEYIYVNKPKTVVYIVPTNALAYELEKSFKENKKFSDYVIFDKSILKEDILNIQSQEKFFFIGTQERFLEIDNSLLGSIDLFVIDEAYKLQDTTKSQRGYKLSETFLDSINKKSEKVFLLSPRAHFKGFEKYQFDVFDSSFNAVEKNYCILDEKDFYDVMLEKGEKEKTILFCKNPTQINDVYENIKDQLTEEKRIENNRIKEFVELLETNVHPDWSVIKLLKAGMLTHHGQMPKYVQNRMINLFNHDPEFKVLLGTNSISEGINTSTKNLFIHPKNNITDKFLMKNTIGRAGRLGQYPIGYIYSTTNIEQDVQDEIEISLAISDEEELAEIEDSKNLEKIKKISKKYNIENEFCVDLLNKYNISLAKLEKLFQILQKECKFSNITNLPFMAKKVFGREYNGILGYDKILIRGYLNEYYRVKRELKRLKTFEDRINCFKELELENKVRENTEIINLYMQFIYSTLEYYIMPIVQIGLEIKEQNNQWKFGKNVIESLVECKKKYYNRTYGNVDVDSLSESQLQILGSLKDYGMINVIRNINGEMLHELEEQLNVRYSTIDVLNAIKRLADVSKNNKEFFTDIKNKYIF